MQHIYNKIYKKLDTDDIDGLIISSPDNVSYVSGAMSRDSWFLLSKRGNVYFTDFRYIKEAEAVLGCRGVVLSQVKADLPDKILHFCSKLRIKNLGFEERYMSYLDHRKLVSKFGSKINLISTHGIIEDLRKIKNESEIKKIRQAVRIAQDALCYAKEIIRVGIKEIEVAAELERFIRYRGAESSSFDIIVASGPNSSFPHHLTSERKLKAAEPVLVDLGVSYQGYKSDLTRVFFLGRISTLVKNIYGIVLKAQLKAIDAIRQGVAASKIDLAARDFINKNGWGKCFGHSLGHGIGLQVHESPSLSFLNDESVKKGMVFTVEPGIYLPGRFGIRLEDMVLVNQKGCEVLSGSLDK